MGDVTRDQRQLHVRLRRGLSKLRAGLSVARPDETTTGAGAFGDRERPRPVCVAVGLGSDDGERSAPPYLHSMPAARWSGHGDLSWAVSSG